MIKPNWDIFKAKFSENPQSNFEWFCYLLFCKEYNQPYGIFRYKNQSAIENNPITKDDNVIGWQAKFYDNSLSKHKDKLLSTIEETKRDYSDITKLLFYTNQEWGQSKGQKPIGLKEIEKKAEELKIELEWRNASFFESEFVCIQNEIIAKHFFSIDKSIFDLIEKLKNDNNSILNKIHTFIAFKEQHIELDRKEICDHLKNISQQIVVLSGIGGVGKTAVIKNIYEQSEKLIPFYIFKGTEFELRNINELFGNFNLQNFVEAHKDQLNKIIVIDSAEKLLNLKNTDPFKEFLSTLINNKWKIIFTTRDNYLEDLNYQFFEIYNIAPLNINIQKLEIKEINSISEKYCFSLPKDEKVLDLIKNPFYLNEYLKFYNDDDGLDYTGFKNKLWNENIKKSKPAREQCFLQIAFKRANEGQFFIIPNCESSILDNDLMNDGILGYETAGYFITHDIYEEWALEKIIENEFIKRTNNHEFLKKIGQSLPIRRSFRNWLSEKLLLEDEHIKVIIEDILNDDEIESFWKDEVLVSVLLSSYAEIFFNIFKSELLQKEQSFLKRLTFLLRIACKEVDEDFFKQLGTKNLNLFLLNYVLTKPKGQGWKSLIKFIFENIDAIGIENIRFVLPIIHDWNSKFKEGETTKFSSLISLQYYQWFIGNNNYFSHDDTKLHLLQTIVYGATEIKDELKIVLENIVKNKWKNHRDPYYDLSKIILTKFEGITVSKALPENILQLADLFWLYTPKKSRYSNPRSQYSNSRMGVEQYFDIEDDHFDYFPASSYQTPIYWLLQSSLKKTVDFILNFTNKTVESFAKSDFAKHKIEEIEVAIDENQTVKQYISNRIWCIYRGRQVAPHVLESMHMALEKYFLENGKNADSKTIEDWLFYLLKNSKSASISAVITSIVLAYPEKTFNVAKILFKTKEFFFYERSRLILDQTQKNSLLMLKNNFGINAKNELHENERIEACDDKHRKLALEHLFLNYQCFRNEETSEEEAENRQKVLWEILDNFYKKLPDESEETESDKTWRLFLARMDRRKMNPTIEKKEDSIEISFNPEIEPKLKEYSEQSLQKISENMKYTSLNLWAHYKMINDSKYKNYKQYEENPKLALNEVKEIIIKLKTANKPKQLSFHYSESESFYLNNYSIPADACSVLLRDHFKELSREEKSFCKDVVLEVAASSLEKGYQYQISDGIQSTISVLPVLLDSFPEEKETVKTILLLTLFNDYPVNMASTNFNVFPIMAIHKLWESFFCDAQSLLFGYLILKVKYEDVRKKLQKEDYNKNIYEDEILKKFLEENEIYIQLVIDNKLTIDFLTDFKQLDLNILKTAFQLIPAETTNEEHKQIVKNIISVFAEKLLSNDRDDRIDYQVRHDFLEKLAYFVLKSPKEEIEELLKPFLDNFNTSESIADLFKEFIFAEDRLNTHNNFWEVWNLFKEKVIELCKNGDNYQNIGNIVKSYLFAQALWKETTKDWHTLKDNDKRFFKEITQKIGHCNSTLYAISKLLNDIGTPYLNDGIVWISDMLYKNKGLLNSKLETNTIYYIEDLVRKYTYRNREEVRKTKISKEKVLIILNFLIEKGSVIGYILRETVL